MAEEDSSAGYTTEEGWFTLDDGEKLYTKTWKPTYQVKAKVIFVHGFSDHCNTYGTLFPDLTARGIAVFAFDQRGWGRTVKSPRQKGLTGPTPLVLSDLSAIISATISANTPPRPLFLFGHSMGGAEVLTWASTAPSSLRAHIRGYLAESPFIALHPRSAPWRVTVAAGRLAAKVLPGGQMVNKLDRRLMSRDQEEGERMAADELCHDTGTFEGLAGMFERAEGLEKRRLRLGKDVRSLWVGHGTDDQLVAFDATKRWVKEGGCEEVADVTWREYEGWYHRLHAELGECKQQFSKEVADWILERSGSE